VGNIPSWLTCSAYPGGKRLIEPFVGGGSVFLNSEKHADFLLADVNPDLINLYQMLALVPDAVENQARWMFEHMGHPDGYELIRKEFNAQTLDTTERALHSCISTAIASMA
jgi:DNA adenine methylase